MTHFMKKEIKDVKSVDQINIDDFRVTDCYEIVDLEKSYRELQRLKMILQVFINLFNHFELYKDCDTKILTSDFAPLTSYYSIDVHSRKCVVPPENSVVKETLYNYILCFLSIEKRENNSNIIKDHKEKTMMKCCFCDEDIAEGEDRCGICDMPHSQRNSSGDNNKLIRNGNINHDEYDQASIKSVKDEDSEKKKYGAEFNNKNIDISKWKCGGCECLNDYTFINCRACEIMYEDEKWTCGGCMMENSCRIECCDKCGIRNINLKDNNIKIRDHRIMSNKVKCEKSGSMKDPRDKKCEGDEVIGKDQWKCGKCGLLQSFDFIECEACYERREVNGLWKCDECTMINKCANVRCGACDKENDYIRIKYCEYCKNEVKCCECRNRGYKVNVENGKGILNLMCEMCKVKKSSQKDCNVCNILNEDEVKIGEDQWKCCKCGLLQCFDFVECSACGESREVNGLWKCTKCTLVNECINNTCKTCELNNDHLTVKHIDTKKQKKDKIDNSKEWQCQNANCHKWTKMDSEYCRECHLFRSHSRIPGDEVMQFKKGQVHTIWICHKCNTFNDLKNQNCSGKSCRNPRFNK